MTDFKVNDRVRITNLDGYTENGTVEVGPFAGALILGIDGVGTVIGFDDHPLYNIEVEMETEEGTYFYHASELKLIDA